MTTNQLTRNKDYRYINDETKRSIISQKKGQYVSGYSVGILYLDKCWYPVLPGNVANLNTYNFPVRLKRVPNCTTSKVLNGDSSVLDSIITAAKQLEAEGARAISAACGFFGNYQQEVASAVNIPVYLSSIIQIPWIQAGLKKDRKIGILTAYEKGMTEKLFNSCGINDSNNCVIADLSHLPEFSAIIHNRGHFNNEIVEQEVVNTAKQLLQDHPEIEAILLECSDLPPYASTIQGETSVPVFDFITLINWIHFSTSQKPYDGFI